jgi:triosephosphate isomerase
MREMLVAGNWKMNASLAANTALLDAIKTGLPAACGVACLVCVPFPYLAQAAQALNGTPIRWGAQNLSQHAKGAYTGEVSGSMLTDFGCSSVLVGHSERRTLYGEDSGLVAEKYAAALAAGLAPVLCVGETLAEREQGVTEAVVGRQLDAVLARCGVAGLARGIVAYEPVWAIGTGRNATPGQAQDVHAFIRTRVASSDPGVAEKLQVLYGGSVKAQNAAELFSMPDIDGGLIGGASLVAAEFLSIVGAATQQRGR